MNNKEAIEAFMRVHGCLERSMAPLYDGYVKDVLIVNKALSRSEVGEVDCPNCDKGVVVAVRHVCCGNVVNGECQSHCVVPEQYQGACCTCGGYGALSQAPTPAPDVDYNKAILGKLLLVQPDTATTHKVSDKLYVWDVEEAVAWYTSALNTKIRADLMCDTPRNHIKTLLNTAQRYLRQAGEIDRAKQMLKIAAEYIKASCCCERTVHYDDADCDGICIADDCEGAIEYLREHQAQTPTASKVR